MAKNTSVSLGGHFDSFISDQVGSGRFGNASEVVRAGLRLLEDSEGRIAILRTMLLAGEQSGTTQFDLENFLKDMDNRKK